jgi:hypothetical protein
MVMDGRNLESASDHLQLDWIDFTFQQYEVSHRHSALVSLLKSDPAAER